MSEIKPIQVWGKGGANPPKVAAVLEELGLPYRVITLRLPDVKKPAYLAINPNGRLPAIHDPNTDLTLWESGAIVEYLVERYDAEHRLGFPRGSNEAAQAKQWLFFQTTGQGPYFGQAVWFKKYHPDPVPSAVSRYVGEINRVTGVLEGHLARQVGQGGDGPWLVGGRYSYADLSFLSWQTLVTYVIQPEDGYTVEDYPHVKDWLARISARPAVRKAMGDVEPLK
ncbi:glutathione S-transferase tpcF [Aspergillus affinis]|uniref:glutathione S-transferase tpcF n=1 Tax=Aspergillus affinis TaxID=1070780 RepID=UPI0022FE843E|nr:uncharacterized protein KD926_004482 [Aspergillus affinis]KAI9035131.1 hypothetical protein KD926_004482 [Aspergillus affinis]